MRQTERHAPAPHVGPCGHSCTSGSRPRHPLQRAALSALLASLALLALTSSVLVQGCESKGPPVVVVLGSSTAEGTGPLDPQNAWVERYRAHLAVTHPDAQLFNLAVGGYTTRAILPEGDPATNIDAALALSPSVILINLPGNDVLFSIPVETQMMNYERVVALAQAEGVPVWIATSQPKNYTNQWQLDALFEVRDETLRRFSPRTLDFWTPFAEADGTIDPAYDSGDGNHLNDAAHAILAQTVIDAAILEALGF